MKKSTPNNDNVHPMMTRSKMMITKGSSSSNTSSEKQQQQQTMKTETETEHTGKTQTNKATQTMLAQPLLFNHKKSLTVQPSVFYKCISALSNIRNVAPQYITKQELYNTVQLEAKLLFSDVCVQLNVCAFCNTWPECKPQLVYDTLFGHTTTTAIVDFSQHVGGNTKMYVDMVMFILKILLQKSTFKNMKTANGHLYPSWDYCFMYFAHTLIMLFN